MKPSKLTVRAGLVRYLRRGVQLEMADKLQVLHIQMSVDSPDLMVFNEPLLQFDEARALLETIGWVERAVEHDVAIDLDRWGGLVLRALSWQYEIEVSRLENAAADGIRLAPRDVPALGDLVAEVRNKAHQRRPVLRWLTGRRGPS